MINKPSCSTTSSGISIEGLLSQACSFFMNLYRAYYQQKQGQAKALLGQLDKIRKVKEIKVQLQLKCGRDTVIRRD